MMTTCCSCEPPVKQAFGDIIATVLLLLALIVLAGAAHLVLR
jgi:hypothetical protein